MGPDKLTTTAPADSKTTLGTPLPAAFMAAFNVAAAVGLLILLITYRTDWGRSHLSPTLILPAALLTLAAALAAYLAHYFAARRYQTLIAIETNLRHLAQTEPTAQSLQTLSPFPAAPRIPPAGRGWNNLITAIDKLCLEHPAKNDQIDMGQLLCAYDSQKLLGLLDSLPDGIVLADADGTVVFANRACEGKIGRPLSEFLARSVLQLFDDPHAQQTLQQVLDHRSGHADDYFEVKTSADPPSAQNYKDQKKQENKTTAPETTHENHPSILWVACHRLNVATENSDILIVIRDITQQRTSESARDQFIAHISHEFRSPLTNIRAYAETLLSDMLLDASAQKEAFNVINEETARLTRLVNDVLDLSRMETGSLNLKKGPVMLDRLIRQSVNDLKATASSKKITLQTNYHPKLPNLYADREKLAVVINNILTNAIKYTPESGTVFVETNVDEHSIYIKITDTGYGIAPEDIDKIFQKFYRVEREETADITGTGLGLATAKEIVTLHSGAINVASQLNHGTEMTIKLPLTEVGPVLGPNAPQNQNDE